jgi:hypothetical protein
MVNIQINGIPIQCDKNVTILQACVEAGENIPSFCYHDRLNIAGNCRICLVQIEGMGKLIESCTVPVRDNLKVFTSTPFIKKARENVMEMLLYNHPLDCAICDQGGECDLQEQSRHFGSDRGRVYENRRGVLDKNCGPLIKTIMTRCIHCTRCVRFSEEIAGKPFFGSLKRGFNTEIAPYKSNKNFDSNISGNVIDLCPVGALTAKPYAFTSRPWEESTYKFETFDFFDSTFPRINLSLSETKVSAITPKTDNSINKEWISDYIRFCSDGLNLMDSLSNLYKFKLKKENLLNSFINEINNEEKSNKLSLNLFLNNNYNIDLNFYILLNLNKRLEESNILNSFSITNFFYKNSFKFNLLTNSDFRSNYSTSINLKDLKRMKNILLLNVPLEEEFPIYYTYLNVYKRNNNMNIITFGLNDNFYNLGFNFKDLSSFIRGKNKLFYDFINKNDYSGVFYLSLNENIFYFLKTLNYSFLRFTGNVLKLNNLNIFSNFFIQNEFLYKFYINFFNNSKKNFKKRLISTEKCSFKIYSFGNYKELDMSNLYISGLFKNNSFISLNSLNNIESQYFDFILPVSNFFKNKSLQSINIFGNISYSMSTSDLNSNDIFTENYYLYLFNKNLNNNLNEKKIKFNKNYFSNESLPLNFNINSKIFDFYNTNLDLNTKYFNIYNKKLESHFALDQSFALKPLKKNDKIFL